MKAIKAKKSDIIKCETYALQLFLAKKEDGAWLLDDDTLDAMLLGGDCTPYKTMRAKWKVNDVSLFGSNVSLPENMIHVLVVVPVNRKRKRDAAVDVETKQENKRSFDEFLEKCPRKGSLPTEGDFLQLFE
ncbi:hypothetical protein V7S43_001698 [Phytophthora oleae]|uniref:Crinkler effector protein N-terminal domain-containing protein n=1 Tax=Phytophthora oleae TaxID=2107226 RepID=A0ABD3GA40_9STRA